MSEIKSFRDIIYSSAEKYGEKIAFKERSGDKVKNYSYNDLKRDAEILGKYLLKKGYKDKKIVLSGKNSYLWCLCYLAVSAFVGTVVPIDKDTPREELLNILDFADASLYIGDNKDYLKTDKLSFDEISKILSEGEKKKQKPFVFEEKSVYELSVLLFTSGTTGMVKGVMLSQNNIVSDLKAVFENVRVKSGDVSLSVLPLHHTYEAIAFLMIVYTGGTVCFSGGIRSLKEDFKLFKPTVLVAVPLLLEKLHGRILKAIEGEGKRKKAEFILKMSAVISEEKRMTIFSEVRDFFGGRLKKIVVGAAALDENIGRDFSAFGFKVIIGYGLTECSPIVICNHIDTITLDSVGKPLKGTEAMIINKDEKGIGEIAVRGSMVMLGYYKNEKATREVLRDGWFKTGDLGYKDKNGFYHITGRKKNVIVTKNGKNIYPEELEHYLLRHRAIKEAIVKSDKGDIISAHIFPDVEAIKKKLRKKELTATDVKKAVTEAVRAVNRKVPSYKNIRTTVLRDEEFPKTATQKIKR